MQYSSTVGVIIPLLTDCIHSVWFNIVSLPRSCVLIVELKKNMNSAKNYSVTVKNNSSPIHGGFLHTWLFFEKGEPGKKYFSLDSRNIECAITSECPAKYHKNEEIAHRIPQEEKTFPISREQHEKMMKKITEMKSTDETYALIPLHKGENNCVTASREVLWAGEIDFLNDVKTPVGVGMKITGDPKYKLADEYFAMNGLLPRASAAIVKAVGLDLNVGPWGWVLGGVCVALGAYVMNMRK